MEVNVNGLFFSLFTLVIFIFHFALRPLMRKGRVKAGFCALWCIDAFFFAGGSFLAFHLYHYEFLPYVTLRNFILFILYLIVTALVLFLAPSGIRLFAKKSTPSNEELLLAEYRFNDTAGLMRNCFFVLLFTLPILFTVLKTVKTAFLPTAFNAAELYAGFCFITFLVLLPLSLRQTLFWHRQLPVPDSETEQQLQKHYSARLRYKKRNRFL